MFALGLRAGRLRRLSAIHRLVSWHVLILRLGRALRWLLTVRIHRLLIGRCLSLRDSQLLLVEVGRLCALGLR